jgi:putative membrane protein
MVFHTILRFLHIVSFAAWFGTILASLFFLKAIESKLTGNDDNTAEYAQLLQRFLKLETKVADVAVIGVILSGIMLAAFYHGWTIPVFVKSLLIVLQIALTIGYIIRSVRTLTYPCSKQEYKSWYRLFGISLTMFSLVLFVSFFLL